MPERLNRLYGIADALMIQFAKTLRAFFIDDQAAFEGHDTNFATPFETDWQTAITEAENEPTDEQRRDQLVQLGVLVEEEMTKSRDNFQNTKRYIEKAFPNNQAVWNEFGYDYDKHRQSHSLMIQFMKRFHATAVKYTAELSVPAVNFTAAKIAEIETRKNALEAADNAQEKFKKDLPVFTRQRIEKLNAVWNICTDVAGVGKFLFKDNAAKYNQYLLPPPEESSQVLQVSGLVTDMNSGSALGQVSVRVELADGSEVATVETNASGQYGIGGLNPDTYSLIFNRDGYQENITSDVVIAEDGDPQEINAQLTPEGSTATISGTVTNSGTGTPISGATVVLFEGADPDGDSLEATTDDDGNYSIIVPGLPGPVSAALRASATGYVDEDQPIDLEPGNDYAGRDFGLTPEV